MIHEEIAAHTPAGHTRQSERMTEPEEEGAGQGGGLEKGFKGEGETPGFWVFADGEWQ